jgi:hypothetical protein
MTLLKDRPWELWRRNGLPTLAATNLMAAIFDRLTERVLPDTLSKMILDFSSKIDEIDAANVLRDINEERLVAGFPQITDLNAVEAELVHRMRYYKNVVKDALNRVPTDNLVKLLTDVVAINTENGKKPVATLVDDLVSAYEVEAKEFFESETEKLTKLTDAIKLAAPRGEAAVAPLMGSIEQIARAWDTVAKPINLSAKSKGTNHEPSKEIAFAIRAIGIDLFNDFKMLEQSQRTVKLLKDVFVDLPDLMERVESDAETIDEIRAKRDVDSKNKEEWEREITYRGEIGLISKEALAISPKGIEWKGRTYPLESITRIRWGGVSHSINGIPTGTTYSIAFGDLNSEGFVSLRKSEIFSSFVDRLWKAVGVRLLIEMLERLRMGDELRFGSAIVSDLGVTLPKKKFFSQAEAVFSEWEKTTIWSADGSLFISSRNDKKAFVSLSYIEIPNAHVLEHLIRVYFKSTNSGRRISSLLD